MGSLACLGAAARHRLLGAMRLSAGPNSSGLCRTKAAVHVRMYVERFGPARKLRILSIVWQRPMQAAIIQGVTVGEDGCVDGHPTARFVEQAPGPPILGSVLMLICHDLTELENVLEDLPGRGFRDDFYSRVGNELWHFTSSKYGKHAYSGLQVFSGECDQGMLFILVILVTPELVIRS